MAANVFDIGADPGALPGAMMGCDLIRSGVVVSRSTKRFVPTASADSDPSMPASSAQSAMEPGAIIVSSFLPSCRTVSCDMSHRRDRPVKTGERGLNVS